PTLMANGRRKVEMAPKRSLDPDGWSGERAHHFCQATNSHRNDMVDTLFQGMIVLPSDYSRAVYRCYPCLRTGVTYVSGPYNDTSWGG
ncbi:MAG: hypothetical protein ACREYC_01335, partial [Gammaproteobacteria bacterium]